MAQNLHLSLSFEGEIGQSISNVILLWTDTDFKLKEISLDLVSTIILNTMQELPKRATKLLKILQLQDLLQESLFVCKNEKNYNKIDKISGALWRISHSLIETNIFQSLPHGVRDVYKLWKLLRTGDALDHLELLPKWNLASYHLKTCLFWKLRKTLVRKKLKRLETKNSLYWAKKILHGLKSFSKQKGSIPNFFVEHTALDIDEYEHFLLDFYKLGCIWLKYPWDTFSSI